MPIKSPQKRKDIIEDSKSRKDDYLTKLEQKLYLDDIAQDQELKKKVAYVVFTLISLEVIAIFCVIFLQGLAVIDVDAGILKVFFPFTLAQVSSMGIIITKYLFSNKK